jgi:beta-ureidopropionase / N-carbamoyl-L-amino-acid hydrolase
MDTPTSPSRSLAATLPAIDPDRLWRSLMDLAALGATPRGGVCRLALTDLDRQARDLVTGWARDAGCSVRVDAIGNVFARRPGSDPERLPVATGSHIDTQPTGGKFDGNYGVLAGLEVLRTLNDAGVRTRSPLELCIWTNEEGSRFVPVMMGSGVYAGAFSLEHALNATDRGGTSVREALQAIGYAGATPAAVADGAPRFGAYFEAHIEQGPVLENGGEVIGVVTGALGQRWFDVTVTGQEAHAGPTPMELRRDALQAALPLMAAVRAIALAEAPDARGTVGEVQVFPNSRNTIPGRVRFTVDLRHPNAEGLQRMEDALRVAVDATSKDTARPGDIEVTLERVVEFAPTPFDDTLVQHVQAAAASAGLPHRRLVSGAGHDAVYVARTAPAAMIFVPCKDGISHNEVEDAQPEHLAAGTQVLLQAMLETAGVEGA